MSHLRVGVAGATGAIGREILKVLSAAPWSPDEIVPLASDRTSVSFVEYKDGQIAVDQLSDQAIEDLDLLFLAVPMDIAYKTGLLAIDEGISVVDVTGVFCDDPEVPVVVPWINPEILAEPPPKGVFALPLPEVGLVGPILAALSRASIVGEVEATILVPASLSGRDGIEELSKQVVALFSAGSPSRKIFPDGLAFDLIPAVGAIEDDGWTEREKLVSRQLSQILATEVPIRVTLVTIPVFSGMSVNLSIRTARTITPDLVNRVLADAGMVTPEVSGTRYLPRPRRVEAQPFVHVGRIRSFPQGNGIQIWAAFDNLRGTATSAVAVAGAMVRGRDGSEP